MNNTVNQQDGMGHYNCIHSKEGPIVAFTTNKAQHFATSTAKFPILLHRTLTYCLFTLKLTAPVSSLKLKANTHCMYMRACAFLHVYVRDTCVCVCKDF